MGEMIQFKRPDGKTCPGYLATPKTGSSAPGFVVIQEWWGLNDSRQALSLVDAIPLLQGGRGRPRHRPDCVIGDRGYDAEAIREGLRMRGISSRLAKRNTEHGSGLGQYRWVVERTFAWLNQFRRLRVRYEKRSDIHQAFLSLASALICWHFVRSHWISS